MTVVGDALPLHVSCNNFLYECISSYLYRVMATVYMAQKSSQKHRISSPGPSRSLDRQVKKRGTGYRLPSQAKYIVESIQKFFEHERLHNKAVMHNRVVDCTAKACGISTTTVHKEFADFSGSLESPEKHYDEIRTRMSLMLQRSVKKFMPFIRRKSIRH